MLDKDLVKGRKQLSNKKLEGAVSDLEIFIDCLKRAKKFVEDHEELKSCICKLLTHQDENN